MFSVKSKLGRLSSTSAGTTPTIAGLAECDWEANYSTGGVRNIWMVFCMMSEVRRKCYKSDLTTGSLLKSYYNLPVSKFWYINLVWLGFDSPTGFPPSSSAPAWQGRRVASSKLWMLEFSAFLEQQQDQDTVRYIFDFHSSYIFGIQVAPTHCECVLYVYENICFFSLLRIGSHLWETKNLVKTDPFLKGQNCLQQYSQLRAMSFWPPFPWS